MLEKLIALVPPPQEIRGRPTEAKWQELEARLGVPFPADYKALINTYGIGWFGGWIALQTPETVIEFANPAVANTMLSFSDWGKPYSFFPEPSGILICAHDDGNSQFGWDTTGESDSWTVINFDNDCWEEFHRPLNLTLSQILTQWFSGELKGDWYPESLKPTKRCYFTHFR